MNYESLLKHTKHVHLLLKYSPNRELNKAGKYIEFLVEYIEANQGDFEELFGELDGDLDSDEEYDVHLENLTDPAWQRFQEAH